VIATLAVPGLAALLGDTLQLAAPSYQSTTCLLLGLKRSLLDGIYWLNLEEGLPFGAVIEHTNFVPVSDYGCHLVYVVAYGESSQDREAAIYAEDAPTSRQPCEKSKGAAEAADIFIEALAGIAPRLRASDILFRHVAYTDYSSPLYLVGYGEESIVPYTTEIRGLYTAGMASAPSYPERSLHASLRAGYECADAVMSELDGGEISSRRLRNSGVT
jgi:protoporphyrinogen oxidase